jgi:hypothetical protein
VKPRRRSFRALVNELVVTGRPWLLAGLATGHSGLAKQLAVLLPRHPLATLLDHRTHVETLLPGRVGGWRRLDERKNADGEPISGAG